MLIGEAARPGSLSQRSTGIAHQGLRPLHSPVKQALIERLSRALAETPNEGRCAQSSLARQLIQSEVSPRRASINTIHRRRVGGAIPPTEFTISGAWGVSG
jgi:hypothetical protein